MSTPSLRWAHFASSTSGGVDEQRVAYAIAPVGSLHLDKALSWSVRTCQACERCADASVSISSHQLGHRPRCGWAYFQRYSFRNCTEAVNISRSRAPPRSRYNSCAAAQLTGSGVLARGSWLASGGEYILDGCSIPTFDEVTERAAASTSRVLFVGDSSLEEMALLFAHASGLALSSLSRKRCTHDGTGSLYRHFDSQFISMRWAGHHDCARAGALPDNSTGWREMLLHTCRSLRPRVIVFNAAVQHLLSECNSATEGEPHRRACDPERTRHRLKSFMETVVAASRLAGSTVLLVTLGMAYTPLAEWAFTCNHDAASLHATTLELLSTEPTLRDVRVIDAFPLTSAWMATGKRVYERGNFSLGCWKSQPWHCSCLGRALVVDASVVLPPCWLTARVVAWVILAAAA